MRQRWITGGAAALCAVALAACGSSAPPRGSAVPHAGKETALDPAKGLIGCLQQAGIPFRRPQPTTVDVGAPGYGTHVVVARTPGAAQLMQLRGEAEGAEVMNRMVLFVGSMPDARLQPIEKCVANNSTT